MDSLFNAAKEQLSVIPPELIKPICLGAVVIILLLLLILFVLGIIYVNSKSAVSRAAPVIKKIEKSTPPPKDAEKKEEKPIKMRYEELPLISGRLGELLALNNIISVGPITKIFLQIIDIIKNTTYDVHWRYKLPCLMLLGPEGSGKSTLLNSLKFEQLSSGKVTPMWKLFKKGAIFEMPKPDATEKVGLFWSFISELFIFIRPRRPLDGLVITIPADMLLSESSDIEHYAKDLFTKIFAFQHEINFRLPIYIIITKSDLIQGFADFAHLLEHHSKQQIFGWSNPNALNIAFSSANIKELFQTIDSGIKKAFLIFSKNNNSNSQVLQNAVLFQSYIHRIRSSLDLYLNAMFQSHNPVEGLLLRGVYFTGKPKNMEASDEILEPSALSPKPYSHVDLKEESTYNDELYFLQDLFQEKIFRESNIAHPIKDDIIDTARNVFRNKLIFAGASVSVFIGWFYGNLQLREKINSYFRSFSNVKSMMSKLQYMEKHVTAHEDQALLNREAKKLLQNLPYPSRWGITSFFVPQSWFSGLHKQISNTIGLINDSVVMRAMFIDLNINTKGIIGEIENDKDDGRETAQNRKYTAQDLFDIESLNSFKKLRNFTDKIDSLKKLSKEYNSILHKEDRKSMMDLSRELFNDQFDVLDAISSKSPNKNLLPPQFDLQVFEEPIEGRLIELFDTFLHELFNGNIEKIFQNICEDIDRMQFISKQANMAYTNADLARVYQKTVLLSEIMQNKNFAWRCDEHFMPSKAWGRMVDSLNASEIVSPDIIKRLLQSAEIEFQKFKDRIRTYKTKMTEAVVSENLQSLTPEFEAFQKELKILLDLPFICAVPNTPLNTVVMNEKMLMWDVRRLKELSDMIDKYYIFSSTIPPEMRVQFFDNYKAICRKCFYPTTQSMLGNAELFDDLPLGTAQNLLENAYRRQADNIQKSSIFLGKIAKFIKEICDEDGMRDCGFAAMIISQYLELLKRIDALFNLETPYSMGREVFDSWDGDKNPRFLNLDRGQALKKYLTSQFNRLKFLAKDLASPVVELFSMPVFDSYIHDRSLLDKWKEIITSIDDYVAQKPGNSVAALESFISETLKKVDINSFDPEGEIKIISEEDGDFFETRRAEVAKALINRADLIQYDKAAAAYNAVKTFFDNNFANKFPFGNSTDEATVTDIEKFIRLYEQKSQNLENILQVNAERKNVNPAVFDFIHSIEKVIPLLKIWVKHVRSSDAQSAIVSFNIALRPSPEIESATSSVLERQLRIRNIVVDDNSIAIFYNSDPVTLTFTWVEGADEKPYDRNLPKNLTVEQYNATFSFGGKWALFRMIEEHKLNKNVEYPNGILLQFDVPVSTQENELITSKMVLKVVPQMREGDKSTPMAWPVFPSECPMLHAVRGTASTTKSVANEDAALEAMAMTRRTATRPSTASSSSTSAAATARPAANSRPTAAASKAVPKPQTMEEEFEAATPAARGETEEESEDESEED